MPLNFERTWGSRADHARENSTKIRTRFQKPPHENPTILVLNFCERVEQSLAVSELHFSAGVYAVVLHSVFAHAEQFCNLPAWQHRLHERADAELHRRERGVATGNHFEIVRVETTAREFGLLPGEMALSPATPKHRHRRAAW